MFRAIHPSRAGPGYRHKTSDCNAALQEMTNWREQKYPFSVYRYILRTPTLSPLRRLDRHLPRLRIATWNLARPIRNGHQKNARRLARIQEIDADIWVLTETISTLAIDGYSSVFAPSLANYHKEDESFTSVCSRWPIRQTLPTFDPYFAVCVEVDSSVGPMLVYGTIITYANDQGPNGTSRRWEEHRKSLAAQVADWQHLRRKFPNHSFCIAGDFNQSRDGTRWYADPQSVEFLTRALDESSMQCVTEMDMRAAELSRTSVDHICVSQNLGANVRRVGAWEGRTPDNCVMSDHNGVYADIDTEFTATSIREVRFSVLGPDDSL